MRENNLGNDLVELNILLTTTCEGFDIIKKNKNNIVDSKLKLLYLIKDKPESPSNLIEKIGLAKSNLTILCNNMIKEGLLKKTNDTLDRRIIFYSLTPKGRKMLEDETNSIKEHFEKVLAYKNNMREIRETIEKLNKLLS